jgi:putative ABC transport system permease protein
MSDWTIILRSLLSRRFSTITTVLTVAIAVALMFVLVTMRESGRRAFERGSGDMHMLVTAEASPLASVLNGIFYASAPRRPLTWEKYEQLSRAFPWAYAVPTQQGDSYLGQPVLATSPEFFSRFRPNVGEPWEIAQGRFFENSFEVVVGATAARITGLTVGDTLFLTHGTGMSRARGSDASQDHVHYDYPYKVVGILRPTGGAHDRALMTNLESTWIIHAHDRRKKEDPAAGPTTAADLIPADKLITGIYMRLVTREGSSAPAMLPQVFDTLRRDTTITVASPSDEIRKLDIIIGNINTLFVAVAAVVMLSSGVAIMLALYNSMEQRRRQIAVLRVLGASQGRIFGLVVTESALIGVLGSATGILLGMVGAVVASVTLQSRIGLVVEATPDPRTIIPIVFATVALACLAGIAPAMLGYRTSVAANLRPLG